MKLIHKLYSNYPLWSIFILAFIVRLLYMTFHLSHFGLDLSSDAGDYKQFAEFMQLQGLFVTDISELLAHAGPGFPFLIYLDFMIFGTNNFWLTLAVGLLSNTLVCVLIYKLSFLLFSNKFVAFGTAIWAVFYLHFIRYTPFIQKENLVFFLFLLCVYAILKLARGGGAKYLLLFCLPFIYLIHVDERYFFYLPFLLIYLFFVNLKNYKWAILVFVFVFIGMTPWLYRNYVVFERPVILTERTAKFTDKVLGYEEPVNPFRATRPNDPYSFEHTKAYELITDSIVKGLNPKGHGYKFVPRLYEAVTDGHIPHTYTKSEKIKNELFELIKPVSFQGTFTAYGYRYMPKWKWQSNLIYGLQYGVLLLMFPIAVFLVLRSRIIRKKEVVFMIILLCLHIVLHLFFGHAIQRYRVPIDFVFIIFGVYTLISFFYLSKFKFSEFFN